MFALSSREKLFEIFDLNTRQITRGSITKTNRLVNFTAFFAGLDPPEWRKHVSVAYFKDKLYYLGGKDPKTKEYMNRVDVRRSNENP